MCSEHSSRTNLCLDRLGTACEERIYEVIFMNVSIANATIIYAKKVQSEILYIQFNVLLSKQSSVNRLPFDLHTQARGMYL